MFIDNASYYKDELMNKEYGLLKLIRKFPEKLFIILAHEEKEDHIMPLRDRLRSWQK